MSLLLSQRDRNQLTEQKENLQEENEGLENANEQLEVDAAKLHLLDIASKKQTDPIHNEISLFEEELRRLIGQSVPQPLQELGFLINQRSDLHVKRGAINEYNKLKGRITEKHEVVNMQEIFEKIREKYK